MNGDPITRSGLRWSFQWKEFVIKHNDVDRLNLFGEINEIETEFLTSKCVEKGKAYPIFFFRSTRFDNVKVLQKLRANNILRYRLRYFLKFVALRIFT